MVEKQKTGEAKWAPWTKYYGHVFRLIKQYHTEIKTNAYGEALDTMILAQNFLSMQSKPELKEINREFQNTVEEAEDKLDHLQKTQGMYMTEDNPHRVREVKKLLFQLDTLINKAMDTMEMKVGEKEEMHPGDALLEDTY